MKQSNEKLEEHQGTVSSMKLVKIVKYSPEGRTGRGKVKAAEAADRYEMERRVLPPCWQC